MNSTPSGPQGEGIVCGATGAGRLSQSSLFRHSFRTYPAHHRLRALKIRTKECRSESAVTLVAITGTACRRLLACRLRPPCGDSAVQEPCATGDCAAQLQRDYFHLLFPLPAVPFHAARDTRQRTLSAAPRTRSVPSSPSSAFPDEAHVYGACAEDSTRAPSSGAPSSSSSAFRILVRSVRTSPKRRAFCARRAWCHPLCVRRAPSPVPRRGRLRCPGA